MTRTMLRQTVSRPVLWKGAGVDGWAAKEDGKGKRTDQRHWKVET
jgi:hypothetical protein